MVCWALAEAVATAVATTALAAIKVLRITILPATVSSGMSAVGRDITPPWRNALDQWATTTHGGAMSQSETSVLIVGGGPIGLALAADLGRRGVQTLLVEKNDNTLGLAKMLEVSVRTMEFCRGLGIAERVRNWGFPPDWPLDSAFVTDMRGYELGRVRTPALGARADSEFSPERGRPCPQTWFDPILQACARSQPSVTLRHQCLLEDFSQDATGVTATLRDRTTGRSEAVRAAYLIGCDGFSSTVRERLGIAIKGEPHLDWSMTIYLRIPDSFSHHDKPG